VGVGPGDVNLCGARLPGAQRFEARTEVAFTVHLDHEDAAKPTFPEQYSAIRARIAGVP